MIIEKFIPSYEKDFNGMTGFAFLCLFLAFFIPGTQKLFASPDSQIKQSSWFYDHCLCRYRTDNRTSGDIFVSGSLQSIRINAINAEFGYFLNETTYLSLAYHISRKKYDNDYFATFCVDCVPVFHGMWLGVGRDFYKCLNPWSGYFFSPRLLLGIESVFNVDFIADPSQVNIFSPAIKPEIQTGYQYYQFYFFAGVNYIYWPYIALTTDGTGIHDNTTGNHVIWDTDLFPLRNGLNAFLGIRFFID